MYVYFTGLKLTTRNQERSFSYALFPTIKQSKPITRLDFIVGRKYVTVKNIRLHELVSAQDIPLPLEHYREYLTEAVVLINTVESYELPSEFVSNVRDIPLHVIVIKRSDGEAILDLLSRNRQERIFAQVLVESGVDIQDTETLTSTTTQNTSGECINIPCIAGIVLC